MPAISLDLDKIDWKLLRVGKADIVLRFWSDQGSPVWSVVALLDTIQDMAVEAGLSEVDVFGPDAMDANPTAVEDDE
jgi:hypothetical protein